MYMITYHLNFKIIDIYIYIYIYIFTYVIFNVSYKMNTFEMERILILLGWHNIWLFVTTSIGYSRFNLTSLALKKKDLIFLGNMSLIRGVDLLLCCLSFNQDNFYINFFFFFWEYFLSPKVHIPLQN